MTIVGQHGYDNREDDMKTTLIASGPHFKSGYKQASMNSVDLYPLMCRILGLRTCHRSSGNPRNTLDMVDWGALIRNRAKSLRYRARQRAIRFGEAIRRPFYWLNRMRDSWKTG